MPGGRPGPTSAPAGRRLAALAVLAVLAGVALAAGVLPGTAAPASAHTMLVSTDPAQDAVLPTAPDRIRFTFNEAVAVVPNGVEVYDAEGVTVASSSTVSGPDLDVRLEEEVGKGTLAVVWRVVGEDGHPVSGSLSFSVGAPSDTVAPVATGSTGATEAAESPRALTVARWVGYVGLLLAVGLVAFTVLLLPTSRVADDARRRLVVVARLSAAVAALAWLVGLPLAAVYQVRGGGSRLAESATWAALPAAEYAATAVVVGGIVVAVALLGHGAPARSRAVAALVAATVAACAPALTGHTRAATPEALAIGADMLHLVAGSVWLGGLVALALVLPDLAGRGTLAAEALARFSAFGAGILAALVLTGSLLAWRIVGSWSALVDSGYGQLLIVKLLATATAVAIAAWNRYSLLPGLQNAVRRRDRRAGARPLVRATTVEAAALVAVLLVTGLLVDRSAEVEASVAEAAAEPAVLTGRLGAIEVRATMSPATIGSSTVTIDMQDPAGEPFEGYDTPRARLSSERVDLGRIRLKSVAPGSYAAEVVLPAPGTWQLQVSLRVSEFENSVTTLELEPAAAN